MKKYMVPILIGILGLVLADWYLITTTVHGYQEKIEILCVMIEEQEQGTDSLLTAIRLLKGLEDPAGELGRERLESYGFLEEQDNWFRRELKSSVRGILGISVVLFGLYLLSLYWVSRKWNDCRRRELREVSQILNRFSDGIFEMEAQERLDGKDTEMERIKGQRADLSEQLRYSQECVQEEREETRSLVTDISHQLKTPVAGVKAYFEILNQENLSEEEEKEFLDQCGKQLQGLENLTGALVNISRMETGMIQIRREPADILETLVQAVNRVYLKADIKQIAIEFEESEDLAATVIPHDVKWVCEAFINILENAVKYSPEHTEIRIRMMRRVTFLRIEFEDQGIGIPRAEYHKVFQRFYRGKAQEVEMEEGSGVGLYLTRQILERHGGSITVSSRYERTQQQGSTFVVQIPYQP